MIRLSRRGVLGASGAALAGAARAETPLLRIGSGPVGGGAERYAAALCAALGEAAPLRLAPRHTQGSRELLFLLDAGQVQFACASLEAAGEAWHGQGIFSARRLRRIRVLAPAFGTPLLLLAPPGPPGWRALAGRRLGCAPAGGAAEGLLRGAAEALGAPLEPTAAESPAALAALWAAGGLDAVLLAPGQAAEGALAQLAPRAMLPEEQAALAAALPGLGPAELAPGVPGLAAWWLLLAQAGLAAPWAEAVTELALSWPPALRAAMPPGALPGAGAEANATLPWHAGALPAWRRRGVELPEGPA